MVYPRPAAISPQEPLCRMVDENWWVISGATHRACPESQATRAIPACTTGLYHLFGMIPVHLADPGVEDPGPSRSHHWREAASVGSLRVVHQGGLRLCPHQASAQVLGSLAPSTGTQTTLARENTGHQTAQGDSMLHLKWPSVRFAGITASPCISSDQRVGEYSNYQHQLMAGESCSQSHPASGGSGKRRPERACW